MIKPNSALGDVVRNGRSLLACVNQLHPMVRQSVIEDVGVLGRVLRLFVGDGQHPVKVADLGQNRAGRQIVIAHQLHDFQ
jgi:hypothetical protein